MDFLTGRMQPSLGRFAVLWGQVFGIDRESEAPLAEGGARLDQRTLAGRISLLIMFGVRHCEEKVIEAFQRYRTPLNMGIELPTIEAIKRFCGDGQWSGPGSPSRRCARTRDRAIW